jgi:hypothetical protein
VAREVNTTQFAVRESGTNSATAPAPSHAHVSTAGSKIKDSAHGTEMSIQNSPHLLRSPYPLLPWFYNRIEGILAYFARGFRTTKANATRTSK